MLMTRDDVAQEVHQLRLDVALGQREIEEASEKASEECTCVNLDANSMKTLGCC